MRRLTPREGALLQRQKLILPLPQKAPADCIGNVRENDGMVHDCCSTAAMVSALFERIRLGCSATSSLANWRLDSASPGVARLA